MTQVTTLLMRVYHGRRAVAAYHRGMTRRARDLNIPAHASAPYKDGWHDQDHYMTSRKKGQ